MHKLCIALRGIVSKSPMFCDWWQGISIKDRALDGCIENRELE
jgi:hypothetical protein